MAGADPREYGSPLGHLASCSWGRGLAHGGLLTPSEHAVSIAPLQRPLRARLIGATETASARQLTQRSVGLMGVPPRTPRSRTPEDRAPISTLETAPPPHRCDSKPRERAFRPHPARRSGTRRGMHPTTCPRGHGHLSELPRRRRARPAPPCMRRRRGPPSGLAEDEGLVQDAVMAFRITPLSTTPRLRRLFPRSRKP